MASQMSTQTAKPAFRALLISRGRRVRMAAMPPPIAYSAQRNASNSENDPNRSTDCSPALTPAVRVRAGLWRRGAIRPGRGLVFRCALGLHLFGDKAPARHRAALDQALRSVSKCIGQGVASDIADRKGLALGFENEIYAARKTLDGACFDIAAHTDALAQRRSVKRGEFGHRMVVSLALSRSHPGQRGERNQNDAYTHAEFSPYLHAWPPVRQLPTAPHFSTPLPQAVISSPNPKGAWASRDESTQVRAALLAEDSAE